MPADRAAAAEQIRSYYAERVTIAELGRRAGTSAAYVSAVIAGRSAASEKLVRAARELGIVK